MADEGVLPAEIEREAKADGARIIEEARAQAETLVSTAEKEALELEQDALRKLETEKKREAKSRLAIERSALRRGEEAMESEIVGKAVSLARDKLSAYRKGPEYRKLMERMLSEGTARLSSPPKRILCRKEDSFFFKGIPCEERALLGGILLEADEEIMDMSFDAAMREVTERMAAEVRRVLFG